jgi:hypothetical protein
LKYSLSVKGNVLVVPPLKGRGSFIAEKRLDSYQLLSIINISMKGFT